VAKRPVGWSVPPTPKRVIYLVGIVLVGAGLAMLPSVAAALWYREWRPSTSLAVSAGITLLAGTAATTWAGRPDSLSPKEAFASVAVAWSTVVWFGALPLSLSGTIPGITDAVFEATAGFTTTGATVITDLSAVSHGILLWRATMQWLGGMGIIVLSVAVLPLIGAGGVQLARAEGPGPEPDRLTPRFRGTAIRLWALYAVLTLIAAVLLAFGDMSVFEAIAHALTNVSSGGFSTTSGSIGAFSAYTQWVVIAFMFIAGTSFALHYRALFRPREYVDSAEFRIYLGIVLGAILLVLIGLSLDTVTADLAVRDGIFTVLTLITGTGYATTNFAAWGGELLILLTVLMFLGGMSGSTTGAVKTYRLALLAKIAGADVRRLTRPSAISVTRFGGSVVAAPVLRNVAAFFVLYVGIFVIGTLLFAFFEAWLGGGVDVITATSAAASTLGNVGPGLGEVGPAGTYAGIVTPGKWVLAIMMLMGRLEIFPILLLLTPAFWRR
jgi:trk system potassium uptake protein TrkH